MFSLMNGKIMALGLGHGGKLYLLFVSFPTKFDIKEKRKERKDARHEDRGQCATG